MGCAESKKHVAAAVDIIEPHESPTKCRAASKESSDARCRAASKDSSDDSESTAPADLSDVSVVSARQETPRTPRTEVPISSASLLERYSFGPGRKKVLGEGTFSVCYLGTDLFTGASVAIKVCKQPDSAYSLTKYRCQVAILLALQEPFGPPTDETLWSEELARVQPSDLFVKLLDYSKDADGNPGRDPVDSSMFVVTELAKHTLRDELKERKSNRRPLTEKQALAYAKDIVLAVAGLHAKGFVHCDLKPENIMSCNGRWKLIDMDGCAELGSTVPERGSLVSYTPCYASPEFARWIVDGGTIKASPLLDAWSVGMTLGELVKGRPLLDHVYTGCKREYPQDFKIQFLKWLSRVEKMPRPRRTKPEHVAVINFLSEYLIVPQTSRRKTLAESLSAPYFKGS